MGHAGANLIAECTTAHAHLDFLALPVNPIREIHERHNVKGSQSAVKNSQTVAEGSQTVVKTVVKGSQIVVKECFRDVLRIGVDVFKDD